MIEELAGPGEQPVDDILDGPDTGFTIQQGQAALDEDED